MQTVMSTSTVSCWRELVRIPARTAAVMKLNKDQLTDVHLHVHRIPVDLDPALGLDKEHVVLAPVDSYFNAFIEEHRDGAQGSAMIASSM